MIPDACPYCGLPLQPEALSQWARCYECGTTTQTGAQFHQSTACGRLVSLLEADHTNQAAIAALRGENARLGTENEQVRNCHAASQRAVSLLWDKAVRLEAEVLRLEAELQAMRDELVRAVQHNTMDLPQ